MARKLEDDRKTALKKLLGLRLPSPFPEVRKLLKDSAKDLKHGVLTESEFWAIHASIYEQFDRYKDRVIALEKQKISALYESYGVTEDGSKESWQRLLCHLGSDYLAELYGNPAGAKKRWTAEEDEKLVAAVEAARTGDRNIRAAIRAVERLPEYKARGKKLKPRYYEAKKRLTPSLASLGKKYLRD